MKKTSIAGLLGLLFTAPIYAASNSIYADTVVTTASRLAEPRNQVIGDISVISQQEIERSGQSTLAELLQTQPGVEIESNGGIGSLSNVRLRGTNIQSVVLLIDGMRISSAANGLTNLSQIALSQVEHIEILRGAASSLYGSDAIGGVIQIFTKQGTKNTELSATAGYGSNNTKQATTNISGAVNETRFSAGITSTTTDGISALRVKTGLDADKDSYRNLSFNGNIKHTITESHEIGLQAFINDGHINLDGDNFPGYQNNKQQILAVTSKNKITDFWLSNIKIGKSIDTANAVGSYGFSNTRSSQDQIYWQNEFNLPVGNLLLAYDRIEDSVKSNTAYSITNRTNNGYVASYQLTHLNHALNVSLREDNNSQFGDHTTGKINYALNFSDFWRISASYGTAFRAPTFNDLYWPFQDFGTYGTFQGNAHLKPETSQNKEISIVFDQGHHRASATFFENNIKNLIVGSQGLYNDSPINLGSASVLGLGLTYEGWISNFHLRASADFQDPKNEDSSGKILSRRAKEHGVIWLGQALGKLEIGSEIIASGKRFNDADNAITLSGYALVNMSAQYKLDSNWSIKARVNNLLDKTYTLASYASTWDPNAASFNTQGTNVFVSVTYSPNY